MVFHTIRIEMQIHVQFSARISKFYAPTDFEHKFNKTDQFNKNLIISDRLDWESAVITTTIYSSGNGKSL